MGLIPRFWDFFWAEKRRKKNFSLTFERIKNTWIVVAFGIVPVIQYNVVPSMSGTFP